MTSRVLPWLTLGLAGCSWTAGRYAGWVERLTRELPAQPEVVGPLRIINVGAGGATSSTILATQIPRLCNLKPTHVFIDPGHVNSSADLGAGPAVSRAQTIADIQAMVAQLRAAIPDVDITLCTMFSISATSLTIHPAYADYVADVIATAALLDVRLLDTYAGCPKPLAATLTYGASPFVLPVTADYLAQADGAAWNAADKAGSIVLAQGDLEAIQTAAGHGVVRGNTAVTAKRHLEFTIKIANSGNPGVGIASAAATLAGYLGSDAHGIGVFGNNTAWRNGGALAAPGFTFGAGDVIGVEIDRVANLVYFEKGAARTPGYDISAIAGTIYPAMSLYDKGCAAVARFTPSGDGLHMLNPGGVDVYHYPGALAWARARAAEHWDL